MKIHVVACAVLWTVCLFVVSAPAQLWTIDSLQAGGWDGYIHLYQDTFDPTNQLVNLLAGNDDGPGGAGTSQILDFPLVPGTDYILVTSGFQPGDAGAYDTTITGPGPVVMFSGDTTGGPLWDRPINAGPSISGLGRVNYDAVPFRVVPEPSCAALLLVGLWGVLPRRR